MYKTVRWLVLLVLGFAHDLVWVGVRTAKQLKYVVLLNKPTSDLSNAFLVPFWVAG